MGQVPDLPSKNNTYNSPFAQQPIETPVVGRGLQPAATTSVVLLLLTLPDLAIYTYTNDVTILSNATATHLTQSVNIQP